MWYYCLINLAILNFSSACCNAFWYYFLVKSCILEACIMLRRTLLTILHTDGVGCCLCSVLTRCLSQRWRIWFSPIWSPTSRVPSALLRCRSHQPTCAQTKAFFASQNLTSDLQQPWTRWQRSLDSRLAWTRAARRVKPVHKGDLKVPPSLKTDAFYNQAYIPTVYIRKHPHPLRR